MQVIPVCEPVITHKEIEYVTEALTTGWISSEGSFLRSFEQKFGEYVGRKHGIAVNNGTNALILAVRALGLPADSEIILPSFTIMSCAMACIYNGLVPVFVDSDPDTWNMDITQIENRITSKTKAIMVVHIYGHPVDMEAIQNIASKHSLYVIEDFAEAIGSEYNRKKCGSFGDISCVSFYANKVITTGEGGMCLTNDDILADRLRKLRNLAFEAKKRFIHYEMGFNFRLTNVQAAIGLAQVERIEELVAKKVEIGNLYRKFLQPLEDEQLVQLPIEKGFAHNTYWMFGIVLKDSLGINAEELATRLSEVGIQTRPFFYPLHLQPVFEQYAWYRKEKLPVSERISKMGLYLPSGISLTEDAISFIAANVTRVISTANKSC